MHDTLYDVPVHTTKKGANYIAFQQWAILFPNKLSGDDVKFSRSEVNPELNR
jgi:hypothetical protein